MTNGKELSAVQKAMTLCIRDHGGWATEQQLVDFFVEHWKEIVAISRKVFQQEPGMRLLHVNTHIRRNWELLFIKKDPDMFGVNDMGREFTQSELELSSNETYEEEEDENEDSSDSETLSECGSEAEGSFDDRLLGLIRTADSGISEARLVQEAAAFADAGGSFPHLQLPRRVRACLLSLKFMGLAFEKVSAREWTTEPPDPAEGKEMVYRVDRAFQAVDLRTITKNDLLQRLRSRRT
jgi:hypothetical protein